MTTLNEALKLGRLVGELKELQNEENTLVYIDNILFPLHESFSIFEFGQSEFEDWKESENYFYYGFQTDNCPTIVNVLFEIVEDKGLDLETVVKVKDWEII